MLYLQEKPESRIGIRQARALGLMLCYVVKCRLVLGLSDATTLHTLAILALNQARRPPA